MRDCFKFVSLACLGGLVSLPAMTQEADSLEEIVVTGSRVFDLQDSPSPVIVVSAEDLVERPATSVTEFLQRHLTSNYALPDLAQEVSDDRQAHAGNRQTGVNLRGLGAHNTLVLINGRRTIEYAAFNRDSGWRTVDVNTTVPSIAVRNIQVLGDGGSAIYGSDAVAGVVNVIPDYGFRGAKLQARSTMFQDEWGSPDTILGALFGVGNDDSSMIFAAEMRQSDPLDQFQTGNSPYYPDPVDRNPDRTLLEVEAQGDLEALTFRDRDPDGRNTYGALGDGPWNNRSRVTVLPDPLCGDHAALGVDPIKAGLIVPDIDSDYVGWTGRRDPSVAPGSSSCDHFNRAYATTQQVEREDLTVFTALEHRFAPNVRATGEVTYAQKAQVDHDPAAYTFFRQGHSYEQNLFIPNNHPGVLYNRGLDPAWNNPNGFVGFVMNQVSFGETMFSAHEYDILRGSFGVEVDITDNWTLSAGYVVATNEVRNSRRSAHVERWQRALMGLGGAACPPDAGPASAGSEVCLFYNPFMSAALPNAAELGLANDADMMAYITPVEENTFQSDFTDFTVSVTGTAGELPGGPVGWAAGFERRTDYLATIRSPYQVEAVLDGQVFPANNFDGEADVNALFVEVGLPIADSLRVQVAGRQEEYNTGLSSFDPKIGFQWTPTDELTLRGSYGTSFRAPAIIHSGDIVIQERRIVFPTDTTVVSPGGMAMGYPVAAFQVGNPDLLPQTSDNISFGADYRFDLDRNDLSVSFSYIDVDFVNLLRVVGQTARLAQPECHIREFDLGNINDPRSRPGSTDVWELLPANPVDPETGLRPQVGPCFAFAEPWEEDQHNTPIAAYGNSQNIARVETQAVDLGLQFGRETPFGYFSTRPQLTYLLKYDTQETEDSETVSAVGFQGDSTGVLAPTMPEIRATIPFGFDRGSHGARLIARYISGVTDRLGTLAIEPAAYVDFNYTWRPNESLLVSFYVNNLTGEINDNPLNRLSFLPPYVRRFGAQLHWDLGQQ